MLIKLLFQKFIVYIMNNLCAKFGCHISSNSKDKQGVESAPPQALNVSNHPGQIGLNKEPIGYKLGLSFDKIGGKSVLKGKTKEKFIYPFLKKFTLSGLKPKTQY